MKRTGLLFLALCGVLACNKPSQDDCRKALANMQRLLGTDNLKNTDFEGEVRRCQGGSSKAAVTCAMAATSLDGLRACDLVKIPDKAPVTPTTPTPTAPPAPAEPPK